MRTALLLSLLAVVAVPAAAGAFERTYVPAGDACLYRPTREIEWAAASPLGSTLPESQALTAIRLSFAAWELETCSDLAFFESERVTPELDSADGRTTLVFRDVRCADVVPAADPCWQDEDCANAYDCWDGDARQIALTSTTFATCDGEIRDSDIEFNAARFRFTVADGPPCDGSTIENCVSTDLENTLVHEIGHVIGLDHSTVRDATMYATAPDGETQKRDLAPDDREALCSIYPSGVATSVCVPASECSSGGSGGDSWGCAAAGGPVSSAGLLLALALLALRRQGAA